MTDDALNTTGNAVVITDTEDVNGGIIREITAVNLNGDTVTSGTLRQGVTAHDAQGRSIVGTASDMGVVTGTLSPIEDISGTLSAPSSLNGALNIPEMYIQPYELPPATTGTLGGIIVGDHLEITEEGRLSVTVANDAEHDNTNPISAAAVYTEVGNINALLATI